MIHNSVIFIVKCLCSVQLDLPSSIKIKGGNLAAQYKAIQLHLHWGVDGGPGSEHTIDGEQFPMEVGTTTAAWKCPLIM